MRLYIDGHHCGYEMQRVAALFLYGEKLELTDGQPAAEEQGALLYTWVKENICGVFVRLPKGDGFDEESTAVTLEETFFVGQSTHEHGLGMALYGVLSKLTGLRPPWGVLTGIRPVNLFRRAEKSGMTDSQVRRYYGESCFVRGDKLDLALKTAEIQQPILEKNTADSVSLYVSIPFCPTRCAYCSFVSHSLKQAAKHMQDYVEALCKELSVMGEAVRGAGLALRTVYFGGGTPTTLTASQLKQVLTQVQSSFDIGSLWEYTVEAGRPDTVDREKLQLLRDFGVGRISINPQTTDDDVLRHIGRGHTAKQFYDAVEIARETGFDSINMDLIAGLPSDTGEGFRKSLADVLMLEPENITVHALAKKRGAHLSYEDARKAAVELEEQVTESQAALKQAGFDPYYLYRQAGSYFGLENVGFTKPNKAGLYNIFSMEESHTVLAAGAGGVSKVVPTKGGRIARFFNFKYPFEYLERFETVLERKKQIFREITCNEDGIKV